MMKIQQKHYNQISFNSGLTKQMKTVILDCDTKKVQNYFEKYGIETDFKENKIAAQCSLWVLQIIQTLNKKYKLSLGLPNGIFVENFDKLNGIKENSFGFTNFVPSYLYKSNNIVIPEKTIFFNRNAIGSKPEYINQLADECNEFGITSTNFFIESFLHEFMHVIHENHMLLKFDANTFIRKLEEVQKQGSIEQFQKLFSKKLRKICDYATTNPLEAVACDLSKRTINSLNKENLIPLQNTFASSPYQRKTFLSQKPVSNLDKIIKKFWDGEFLQ